MHISVDVTDRTGKKLMAAAPGGDLALIIEQLAEKLPEPEPLTPANDPLLARLEQRIANAPTDPKEIAEAEKELLEFKRNMNAPRKEAGARLHFPEVEEE